MTHPLLKRTGSGAARSSFVAVALILAATSAHAADGPAIDSGDTAWLLVSTALVLFMMIPGLAFFMPVWSARRMCFPS